DMLQFPRAATPAIGKWRTSKAALRLRLSLALVLLDLVAIGGAYLLASLLRLKSIQETSGLLMMATSIPLYVLCGALTRAFSPVNVIRRGSSIGRSLQALVMASVLLTFLFYLLHSGTSFSR